MMSKQSRMNSLTSGEHGALALGTFDPMLASTQAYFGVSPRCNTFQNQITTELGVVFAQDVGTIFPQHARQRRRSECKKITHANDRQIKKRGKLNGGMEPTCLPICIWHQRE